MKKIIKGRLYNTETAKLIGEWSNNLGKRDFNFVNESLYLTKSGAYFLYGEGGANTKYSESCGNNSWSGGAQIQPMSLTSAREWAEENLEVEEYEKAFGEVEEASSEKVILNISISSDFKNRLTREREETGKSISQIIEDRFSE